MYEHSNTTGQLVWGLILMTIGFAFLLDRLNVIHFARLIQLFWPLMLIVIGVLKLVRDSGYRRRIREE